MRKISEAMYAGVDAVYRDVTNVVGLDLIEILSSEVLKDVDGVSGVHMPDDSEINWQLRTFYCRRDDRVVGNSFAFVGVAHIAGIVNAGRVNDDAVVDALKYDTGFEDGLRNARIGIEYHADRAGRNLLIWVASGQPEG